ncbi:MAG: hypothetical protein NTU83_04075 [Candidatus Hydrogenedentes bacterium]|nr:hypothetical protein [Candidatus Hydrogenedentota bacterium]
MAAAKQAAVSKHVDPNDIALALAKAISDGDIVNFRLVFAPFSPARRDSSQSFDMAKYAYLLPDDEMERDATFQGILARVKQPDTMRQILGELDANRPAQLPSDLLLPLADQAVRHGKYSSAAQAYELLRVRARVQGEFLTQADAALDAGDLVRGAHGYIIAAGLAYDYAAFPEPLPAVPDYQTRALMLHGVYPERPEDCPGVRATKPFLSMALSYLMDSSLATRLDNRSDDVRLPFFVELVRRRDPAWDACAKRYREATEVARGFGARLERRMAESVGLAEEIEEQLGEDPRRIPAILLGRTADPGDWWQYLKEIAYEHPAGALFLARQTVGDCEILVPRYIAESEPAHALGLTGN